MTTTIHHLYNKGGKYALGTDSREIARVKFTGMVKCLQEQEDNGSYREMTFEDRLGYLVEQEYVRGQTVVFKLD